MRLKILELHCEKLCPKNISTYPNEKLCPKDIFNYPNKTSSIIQKKICISFYIYMHKNVYKKKSDLVLTDGKSVLDLLVLGPDNMLSQKNYK